MSQYSPPYRQNNYPPNGPAAQYYGNSQYHQNHQGHPGHQGTASHWREC